MSPLLSRRAVMIGAVAALASRPSWSADGGIQARFRELESDVGGRLGVAALDMENDRRIDYRSASLFPMCSTYKVLLVGAVLSKVDHGKETLERPMTLTQADMLDYAPDAKQVLAKGRITIAEACISAILDSDKTAANLLLSSIGGPGALTLFARELGDKTTHLDRNEPFLDEAAPGDARDTTSPAAMLNNLGQLLLTDALSQRSRDLLIKWMVDCRTGQAKLRAGLPADWKIGDKTGIGAHGTNNDIAIAWPTGRKPLLISAFLTATEAPLASRNKVLAEVGRLIAAEMISGS